MTTQPFAYQFLTAFRLDDGTSISTADTCGLQRKLRRQELFNSRIVRQNSTRYTLALSASDIPRPTCNFLNTVSNAGPERINGFSVGKDGVIDTPVV